jgi:lysophospholipase L1-like esterase
MTTFAALGDSITLGIGDPDPGGRSGPDGRTGRAWRGWAALLAEGLADPELHILAASGACAAQIEQDQLPRALALRPQLASVVFGINDTLRPGFDPDRIAASAGHTVGALRAAGSQVLTMRLPDAGRMLGLPSALARPLAHRTQQVNAVLDAVAARFGTVHFDAAGTPETYERRMWAVDRLHPNERGHRLIARSFHDMLAAAGYPVGPPPAAEPANPPPTRVAEVAWMATKGTAWVLRRSTDLVPYLLAMAAAEMLRSARQRPHVACKPSEQLAQGSDLALGDAVAQPLIEGDGGRAQREEHFVARLRELDDVNAPVGRVAMPADEACCLHGVEMVGQRGLPDPDYLR